MNPNTFATIDLLLFAQFILSAAKVHFLHPSKLLSDSQFPIAINFLLIINCYYNKRPEISIMVKKMF